MSLLLESVLAATPIAVVLVLMVVLGRSAAAAGLVALVVSVALALSVFDPTTAQVPRASAALAGAGLEAIFTAATILWIIFGALCLYHLQQRTGALDQLRDAIGAISKDPRIVAILIAWFFAIFAEGAAGFGTAVALAAPFLVGFGFEPVEAVVISLIGHSVGVSFGAVGTPVVAQAQLVPYEGLELGWAAAGFHVVLGWVMLVALLRLVPRPDQESALAEGWRTWAWAGAAAAAYLAPMYVIARFVGPELPSLAGAIVGSILFIGGYVVVSRRGGQPKQAGKDAGEDASSGAVDVLIAASPYLVVIALVLMTRLVAPLQQTLVAVEWSWSLWERFNGRFQPLFHPGTLLMAGFLGGALLQRASFADVRGSVADALRKLGPVTLALGAMLALSRVMVHAGMIDTLAAAAAAGAAGAWPFLSPWVGVLGTFVTGSATASNILFSEFQLATAARLEMPALTLLGAQNFGAAVGNIICPHNIVAGGATVGIVGRESEILRRTLGACLVYATLGGLLGLWFVYVGT